MRILAGMVIAAGLLVGGAAWAEDPAPAPTASPAAPVVTPDATAPVTDTAVAPPAPAIADAPAVVPTPRPPAPVVARADPYADGTPAQLDDAAFDAAFQCPEALSGAENRMEELARYFAWARERHPDWNFRKRLDVRYGLLRRHACATTLASITASARPPFSR